MRSIVYSLTWTIWNSIINFKTCCIISF
jgi:hypothetical protein